MTTQDQNDILYEHVYTSEVETIVLPKISKENCQDFSRLGTSISSYSRILACKINKIRSNLVIFCSYYPCSHENQTIANKGSILLQINLIKIITIYNVQKKNRKKGAILPKETMKGMNHKRKAITASSRQLLQTRENVCKFSCVMQNTYIHNLLQDTEIS
jgi:hypothetical protein